MLEQIEQIQDTEFFEIDIFAKQSTWETGT
jgi:hypothetical protein